MIKRNTLNRTLIGVLALVAIAVIAFFAFDVVSSAKAEATEGDQLTVVRAADGETAGENTDGADTKTTETAVDNTKSSKAIAAAIVVGLAAAAGAIAMGFAIAKSNEAISRQPEASSKISSGLMLGLVFIETAIIYALIVAILVIFVL